MADQRKYHKYMQVTGLLRVDVGSSVQTGHLTSFNKRPSYVYLALHGSGPGSGCHWPRRIAWLM